MKKTIAFILVTFISVCMISFTLIKKTGRAGNTGSPGENTCTQCHNAHPVNSGPGLISLQTDMPDGLYEPDSTYNFSVIIKHGGLGLFGFGLEALKTGNTDAGLIIVTDGVRTQILTAANGRKNITHKLLGGDSQDSAVFNFKWTAPTTNVGPVTFYYSGIAADSSNTTSGDYVYKGQVTFTSLSTASIDEQDPYNLSIRPFPSGQYIDVLLELNTQSNVELEILNLSGQRMDVRRYDNEEPGHKSYTIFTSKYSSGIYILNLRVNAEMISRKFVLI